MTNEQLVGSVELFRQLPQAMVARIAAAAVRRSYNEGDVIVGEGERGVAFYVIVEGRAAVVRNVQGVEATLALLQTNDFFGELALLDNGLRSATVRAVEPTECLVLPSWVFNAERDGQSALSGAVLKLLTKRIRELQENV